MNWSNYPDYSGPQVSFHLDSMGLWVKCRNPCICWLMIISTPVTYGLRGGFTLSSVPRGRNFVALIFTSFLSCMMTHQPHHILPAVDKAGHDIIRGEGFHDTPSAVQRYLPVYSALASPHLVPFPILAPVCSSLGSIICAGECNVLLSWLSRQNLLVQSHLYFQ